MNVQTTFMLVLGLAAFNAPAAAQDATDASFLLRASASDWENYFPGQLANGYVSTLTSPRGTVGTASSMVALMDYHAGDVSRPAAIPGWTEIDYSTGNSPAGHFWMNQVDLDRAVFQHYSQVLDLHQATLTTRYRYRDHGRATDI